MNLNDLLVRVDQIIEMADQTITTETKKQGYRWVDSERSNAFRAAGRSFVSKVFGQDHPYYSQFDECTKHTTGAHSVEMGRGVLGAIREELAGGWLTTLRGLVSAEVFADFLEMAQHLLDEDYKDAAAVITGSVLEEHLRQLCTKHGISAEYTNQKGNTVPKKADSLNSELAKAGAYSPLDKKNVTAWLGLRNSAAHGKYDDYTAEQVGNMLLAVTEFMARVTT
jgi:hypothetical protein